jgi:uncharacterized membrane protein YecN with MAPEG domain
MPVTAFYAALIAFLFLYLSRNVILARRKAKVGVGDGGDKLLLRAMRVQANCAEYAPLGIILIGLCESLATPAFLLHALGLALISGRVVHAHGVSQEPENFRFRVVGMSLTFLVIAIAAFLALGGALMQWLA